MTGAQKGLANWHRVIDAGSKPEDLAQIIAEDAVFHSPVVHTPQMGRAITTAYLAAAGQTLGNASFRYEREILDGNTLVLEFTTEMEGVHVNGIDMITFDDEGMIQDFKVMVRPLKAVNKVWEMMGRQLEQQNKA